MTRTEYRLTAKLKEKDRLVAQLRAVDKDIKELGDALQKERGLIRGARATELGLRGMLERKVA